MNVKSMTGELDRMPVDRRLADHRSPRRDRCSAPPRRAARRTGAGRRSRAGRPSGRPPPPRRTSPGSAYQSIRARAPIGKWWPQWPHTHSAAAELVVAVVRAALGAGVRVLASRPGAERACARPGRRSGPRTCQSLDPARCRPVTRPPLRSRGRAPSRGRAASLRADRHEAGEARRRPAPGSTRASGSRLVEGRAARLGHEDVELAGLEHVAVERDVDAFSGSSPSSLRIPAARDEVGLGRVEVAGPEQRHVARQRRRRRRSASAAASPRRFRTASSRACSDRRGRRSRRRRGGRGGARARARRRRARSSSRRARAAGPAARAPSAAICSSSVGSSIAAASGHGSAMRAASAIASPPSPHARGTRTSPAANSRPQEWHWYSGPIATAVSVRQSGHRARSALTDPRGTYAATSSSSVSGSANRSVSSRVGARSGGRSPSRLIQTLRSPSSFARGDVVEERRGDVHVAFARGAWCARRTRPSGGAPACTNRSPGRRRSRRTGRRSAPATPR